LLPATAEAAKAVAAVRIAVNSTRFISTIVPSFLLGPRAQTFTLYADDVPT
jgi:hypothetical protein